MNTIKPKEFNKFKKYLISGLPPSTGGVGRLMQNLIPEAKKNGYAVIHRRQATSIRALAKKLNFIGLIKETIERFSDNLNYTKSLCALKNSEIIILHPQSISLPLINKILKKNKVSFYVMDNSFFCMRSYNNNPLTGKECLKCITSLENAEIICKPWPSKYKKNSYIREINQIRFNSKTITFLAQNELQSNLLKQFYGKNVTTKIVGLNTGELEKCFIESNNISQKPIYDFVFHGASHIAKGLEFVIELATAMPQRTFFIPDDLQNIEKTLNRKIENINISYSKCNWETGLKSAILNCKIVLNLSVWSAPIEGALLKSVVLHPKVATIETEFGFEKELSQVLPIIRLPHNTKDASLMLERELNQQLIKTADINFRYKHALRFSNASNIFKLDDA